MAKISQLPLVTEPDGSETFVVLKDGMAQRVPGAALIGAAGEVSLEQVQAAASAAQTSAQAAQASAQSAAQDASDAQAQAQAATQKADATAAALDALVLPSAQPLRDRLCLHHRAGPFRSLRLPCGGRGLHMACRLCRGLRPCRGRSARRGAGAHPQGRQGAGGHLHLSPDGTITASSQAAIPVARGALITLEGPATPDTGAAQIGLTLIGTRT
jgi:hypothetical protein